MGSEVIAKREQMELYYRTAISTVFNPYNITVRFTTTPPTRWSTQVRDMKFSSAEGWSQLKRSTEVLLGRCWCCAATDGRQQRQPHRSRGSTSTTDA